jgi:hypothetical protein
MTITTPWRRITLQYSQRGFTDARTFTIRLPLGQLHTPHLPMRKSAARMTPGRHQRSHAPDVLARS